METGGQERLEEERTWSWSSPEEKLYFRHIQIKGDVLTLNADSQEGCPILMTATHHCI